MMSETRKKIDNQLQYLHKHTHLKNVEKVDHRLIQMVYDPWDIKSHHGSMTYRIKMQLPSDFPDSPPILKFVDPIDHINICKVTGEVCMPILVEDWSPYISLGSIIDLLDALLIEPETNPQYCNGSSRVNRGMMKSSMSSSSQYFQRPSSFTPDSPQSRMFNSSRHEPSTVINPQALTATAPLVTDEEATSPMTPSFMKKKMKRLKTIMLQKAQLGSSSRLSTIINEPPSPSSPFTKALSKISPPKDSMNFDEIVEVFDDGSVDLGKADFEKSKKLKLVKSDDKAKKLEVQCGVIHEQSIEFMDNSHTSRVKIPKSEPSEESIMKKLPRVNSKESNQNDRPALVLRDLPKMNKKLTNSTNNVKNKELFNTKVYQNSTYQLDKIKVMIDMFTEEYWQLERKKKSVSNDDYMLKLVNHQIQEHKELLDQLHSLANQIRKGMVESIKKQIVGNR